MAESWPDWRIGADNAAELARYVDTSYTRVWVPANVRGPWYGPAAGEERARRLYNELRDHRIGYAHEPWNPRRHRPGEEFLYQRIRSPEETLQGPATCLDLVLVYAGMALYGGIRAFIGLQTAVRSPDGEDEGAQHALIVLDVREQLSDVAVDAGQDAPPFATGRPGDSGVWDLPGDVALADLAAAEGWLVVDVARAARHGGRPAADFSEAVGRQAAGELATRNGNHRWALVDVDAVLGSGSELYRPPTGLAIPPIHSYLPAVPAFHEYGTRQPLLDRLLTRVDAAEPGEPSVVVLAGPQGYGKSMLAHRLAVAADHGCGWFLNASSVKSLTASLAMAERQEKELRDGRDGSGASGEKPDAGEDRALASAALDRLRHAERPWVVVLDNCDIDPGTSGLAELIPVPHHAGQTTIITTTDEGWQAHALTRGWAFEQLSALDAKDLGRLELPPGLDRAVAGRPLIAQALAALQDGGAALPEQTGLSGPELVWTLVRDTASAQAVAVARTLAWCPPEPANAASLLAATAPAAGSQAADFPEAAQVLDRLRFVTLSFPVTGTALLLHRLFAAAVREQTWRDEPGTAADVIGRLLTREQGQEIFLSAAEETALARLEPSRTGRDQGEVTRAEEHLADEARRGLLWHGLGRVRERRGPVKESGPHFENAIKLLSRDSHRAEVAESMIGLARIVYQSQQSGRDDLLGARRTAEEARELLAPLTDRDATQLGEQANALAWLITQKLTRYEPDLGKRAAALAEVRENLWRSYEKRRRILRPDHAAASGSDPEGDDGLGSERAFFNLAGVNIQLAKTHYRIMSQSGLAAREKETAMAAVTASLAEAARVYGVVRGLREQRYAGRAHPHLASCIHGQALIAYFRAGLLGERGQYPAAFDFASTALEQRQKVAGGLAGPGTFRVLVDNDVTKSVEFMFKLSFAALAARSENAAGCAAAVERILAEVPGEFDGDLPVVTAATDRQTRSQQE